MFLNEKNRLSDKKEYIFVKNRGKSLAVRGKKRKFAGNETTEPGCNGVFAGNENGKRHGNGKFLEDAEQAGGR